MGVPASNLSKNPAFFAPILVKNPALSFFWDSSGFKVYWEASPNLSVAAEENVEA